MIEPKYIVSLNSKPTHCHDEPDGPWAADVYIADGTDTDGVRSARWLVASDYEQTALAPLSGEPGFIFKTESETYMVPEHDVDEIRELQPLCTGTADGLLMDALDALGHAERAVRDEAETESEREFANELGTIAMGIEDDWHEITKPNTMECMLCGQLVANTEEDAVEHVRDEHNVTHFPMQHIRK